MQGSMKKNRMRMKTNLKIKSFHRSCPKCNKEIKYSGYSNFCRARKRNTVCKSCMISKGKFSKFGTVESWKIIDALQLNSNCSQNIVRRLFASIFTYRCKLCGNPGSHNNEPLTLHLDHKNGNRRDNRKKNLRWLCPNCHQQTDTWGRKA